MREQQILRKAGFSVCFVWCVFVLASFGIGGLQTSYAQDSDFPSFDPGFSFESARSSVLSYIREWQEDDAQIESDLTWYCFAAGMDSVAKPLLLPSVSILLEMDAAILERDREGKLVPGRVLQEPIAKLLRSVDLTQGERSRAEDLKNRVALNTVDRLKIAADSQWFLMEVSERIFSEYYQEHLARTEGWVGMLRYFEESCRAFQVRRDRNQSLTRAAKRVLALYAFLERESGKDFSESIPSPLNGIPLF